MITPRMRPEKVALTLDEQVARLRDRGMRVVDDERARHFLGHLNYYRLRGYWIGSELPSASGEHEFGPGTDFDEIIALYDFDRRLRLLVNDAVERVEVSLRTGWAYVLGHAYGPIAHRDPRWFNKHHDKMVGRVEALFHDRKEIYLRHYLDRNEEPPIWALCEALSFGDLSKWLAAIRDHTTRQQIADIYGLAEVVLCSFNENLVFVRNVCAHHGRLWNRVMTLTMTLPKKPSALRSQMQLAPELRNRIYNTLLMLAWLMRRVSPGSEWHLRVREHAESRPDLWFDMGFPDGWKLFDLWQEAET